MTYFNKNKYNFKAKNMWNYFTFLQIFKIVFLIENGCVLIFASAFNPF